MLVMGSGWTAKVGIEMGSIDLLGENTRAGSATKVAHERDAL